MITRVSITLVLLLSFVFRTQAQLILPKASPFAEITQEIGLSTIKIQYSRPAARSRQLFDGLVPYGRIWRVGANESTKFCTDQELEVMGNKLPPGTYALYAFPDKESWEIVFHNNTTHWGDGRTAYDPKEDAFRIKVIPRKTSEWQETFQIDFDSISHNEANMRWKWGNTTIAIPIIVHTKEIMLNAIDTSLEDNPTAQTYYEAARYLQEEEMEYPKALEYLERAIALGGDTYYFYRVKSLVEAEMQNYKAAIRSAERSLELSKAEAKDEFVRMNQQNIKEWKILLKSKEE